MFCSDCTEYSREALGPLLGPSILLRRGKNVPPETFITRLGPPLCSAKQAQAQAQTQAQAQAQAQAPTYSNTRRLYQTSRRLDHYQHSLTHWPFDNQIHRSSQQLGVLVPESDQTKPQSPSQSPKAGASQHPASCNQRLDLLLTEDSGSPHVSSTPTPTPKPE
jgi:hypothetical protein